MKRIFFFTGFIFISLVANNQKLIRDFEAVIKSGSSVKAFEFVRNTFGLPYAEDPFLHFKERGIKKLISFCSYGERRIEATSLIKFSQTKEFWTNFSNQFTAGKWKYRKLYKNDSIAWEAANYSITLIYAHEMGHYMSFRFINPEMANYTCEEVVANECLTAFANLFNGNKKFDAYRKLFIELSKQIADAIPDSAKTAFKLPMEDWCKSNPMDSFFQYFEKDEERFLRLYGFLQFRMMENLLQTRTESLESFSKKRFTNFYKKKTAASFFAPQPFKILKSETLAQATFSRFFYNKMESDSLSCYKTYSYNNDVVHLDKNGNILSSGVEKTNLYPDTSYDDPAYDIEQHTMWNYRDTANRKIPLQGLSFLDSIKYARTYAYSAYKAGESFWYLIKRIDKQYGYRQYMAENSNTDSLDKLPERNSFWFLYLKPMAGNKISYRQFELPDSLSDYSNIYYRDLHLAGYNDRGATLINNEYLNNNRHRITLMPVDTNSLVLGDPLFQYESSDSSFFNIELPTAFFDTTTGNLIVAFYNPVTERIYLLTVTEKGMKGTELNNIKIDKYNSSKMIVTALRLIAPNKIIAIVKTKKPGNSSKIEIKRLILQW